MQKDYITILRAILKEHASHNFVSSAWRDDLFAMQMQLTFIDVLDAINELLDQIELMPGIAHLENQAKEYRQLLMDRQEKHVTFNLLIDQLA